MLGVLVRDTLADQCEADPIAARVGLALTDTGPEGLRVGDGVHVPVLVRVSGDVTLGQRACDVVAVACIKADGVVDADDEGEPEGEMDAVADVLGERDGGEGAVKTLLSTPSS